MSLRDDLIAARALIDAPEKWCKGSYHNEGRHDAHCIIGAVRATVPWWESGRHSATLEALSAALPKRNAGATLWEFNDSSSTKHPDVLALVDCAISRTEGSAR